MKRSPTCIQIPSSRNYNQEVKKLCQKLNPECERFFINFRNNLNSNFMWFVAEWGRRGMHLGFWWKS
jgi:hypothetical protein